MAMILAWERSRGKVLATSASGVMVAYRHRWKRSHSAPTDPPKEVRPAERTCAFRLSREHTQAARWGGRTLHRAAVVPRARSPYARGCSGGADTEQWMCTGL